MDGADRQRLERAFVDDFKKFSALAAQTRPRFVLDSRDCFPCLDEKTATTSFDRHYVFHTAWAARCLARARPARHVDISSSLYFCSLVSAFIPVDFYDYRPPHLALSGLNVGTADLQELPFKDGSLASLSCMHVVEHVGLGRYGDALDYDGDVKAMRELARVTASGGNLFFVVPIGKARIQFNAHRIYDYDQVIRQFSSFQLREFALIPDGEAQGGLIAPASKLQADQQNYGCGCFWFVKN